MATFNPAAGAPSNRSVPSHGLKGVVHTQEVSVAVTTSLGLNDILNYFYLPAGATIRGAHLRASTKLDTHNGPALTIDVGDAGLAARIFSASLVGGTTSGSDDAPVWAAIGYQYTADTLIFATVHAAGTTKAAGSLTLKINYTIDGLAS